MQTLELVFYSFITTSYGCGESETSGLAGYKGSTVGSFLYADFNPIGVMIVVTATRILL